MSSVNSLLFQIMASQGYLFLCICSPEMDGCHSVNRQIRHERSDIRIWIVTVKFNHSLFTKIYFRHFNDHSFLLFLFLIGAVLNCFCQCLKMIYRMKLGSSSITRFRWGDLSVSPGEMGFHLGATVIVVTRFVLWFLPGRLTFMPLNGKF